WAQPGVPATSRAQATRAVAVRIIISHLLSGNSLKSVKVVAPRTKQQCPDFGSGQGKRRRIGRNVRPVGAEKQERSVVAPVWETQASSSKMLRSTSRFQSVWWTGQP